MSELDPNNGIDGNESDLKSGGDGLGWRAQLPDDLKTNETFTAYKTVGDLAKSHLDTAGKVKEFEGKLANSIPKLTENSTEEEKVAYYKAIGRPDTADGYEVKVPEGLPLDENTIKWFKETAFELDWPKEDADKFLTKYFKKQKSDIETIDKYIKTREDEAQNKLKQEWGSKYQEEYDLALKTAQQPVFEEVKKYLDSTTINSDAVMVKFWNQIGKMMSESAFVRPGGSPEPEPRKTPGGQPLLRFPSMENQTGG